WGAARPGTWPDAGAGPRVRGGRARRRTQWRVCLVEWCRKVFVPCGADPSTRLPRHRHRACPHRPVGGMDSVTPSLEGGSDHRVARVTGLLASAKHLVDDPLSVVEDALDLSTHQGQRHHAEWMQG